jgi:hypothetical protein
MNAPLQQWFATECGGALATGMFGVQLSFASGLFTACLDVQPGVNCAQETQRG